MFLCGQFSQFPPSSFKIIICHAHWTTDFAGILGRQILLEFSELTGKSRIFVASKVHGDVLPNWEQVCRNWERMHGPHHNLWWMVSTTTHLVPHPSPMNRESPPVRESWVYGHGIQDTPLGTWYVNRITSDGGINDSLSDDPHPVILSLSLDNAHPPPVFRNLFLVPPGLWPGLWHVRQPIQTWLNKL